jgi:hypothetical protein
MIIGDSVGIADHLLRSLTFINFCAFSRIHWHAQPVLPFKQNTHHVKPDKPSLHAAFAELKPGQ